MIEQLCKYITVDNIVCVAGLFLFAGWLLKTSLGRKALSDSSARRNNMPFYMPFVPLFVWIMGGSVVMAITGNLTGSLKGGEVAGVSQSWQSVFWENLALALVSLVTMAVIIILVRATFARGLRGFGLNLKKIHKDILPSFFALLSVWPLLLAAIILTTFFGQVISGPEYEIERHEQLKIITAYPQLPVRIIIAVIAIVLVPVLEEMLFRGLFQTMIRSFLESLRLSSAPLLLSAEQETNTDVNSAGGFQKAAWASVVITSLLFAAAHQNVGHWPALFLLGMCLGYTYEKSGSLFQPIFIHCLFNGITIAAVLA